MDSLVADRLITCIKEEKLDKASLSQAISHVVADKTILNFPDGKPTIVHLTNREDFEVECKIMVQWDAVSKKRRAKENNYLTMEPSERRISAHGSMIVTVWPNGVPPWSTRIVVQSWDSRRSEERIQEIQTQSSGSTITRTLFLICPHMFVLYKK